MKRLVFGMLFFLASMGLGGCNTFTNQDVGTVAGGIAGGLLGSTVGQGGGHMVAIAAGTLAGAYLGGAVGKHMDDLDRMKMNHALNNNSVGEPAYWRNTRTGAHYKVVPVKNVAVRGNKYCREYRTMAEIGGHKQEMYGTACRQPDGSWKAIN